MANGHNDGNAISFIKAEESSQKLSKKGRNSRLIPMMFLTPPERQCSAPEQEAERLFQRNKIFVGAERASCQ